MLVDLDGMLQPAVQAGSKAPAMETVWGGWGVGRFLTWLDFLFLSPVLGHMERGPKKRGSWRG